MQMGYTVSGLLDWTMCFDTVIIQFSQFGYYESLCHATCVFSLSRAVTRGVLILSPGQAIL